MLLYGSYSADGAVRNKPQSFVCFLVLADSVADSTWAVRVHAPIHIVPQDLPAPGGTNGDMCAGVRGGQERTHHHNYKYFKYLSVSQPILDFMDFLGIFVICMTCHGQPWSAKRIANNALSKA